MDSKSKGTYLILTLVIAAFFYGVVQLFLLGLEVGDAYSPYSSFRSDPLGIGALYGAVGSLDGVSAERNLEPLLEIGSGNEKTLLICGATTSKDPENVIEALERFVADGGRLIIAFYPLAREPEVLFPHRDQRPKKSKKEKKNEDSEEDENELDAPWLPKLVSIGERWGFSFGYWNLSISPEGDFGKLRADRQEGALGFPPSLTWHTALFFKNLDGEWRTLYSTDKGSAIIERPWEKGTIVLCSDSYLFSNEAMRNERYPGLLAWFVGPSSTVIFDETHLGIREQPGIMTLVRKYRLYGFLVTIILLAVLFVWKNALSLVPKREGAPSSVAPSACNSDVSAGLVNLLRRSISSKEILSVCIEEWDRAFIYGIKSSPDQQARIQALVRREAILPRRQRDPVNAYRKICSILAERE